MSKKAEQVTAYMFGVVFLITMLVLAVIFPKPTPFQYIVFRVILSIATAGVAAMIPGFIEIEIPNLVRAGGALAVFVVVYFYNPAALITNFNPAESIEPLQPPIIDRTPKSGSFLRPFFDLKFIPIAAASETKTVRTGLTVARLLEGQPKDSASKIYDVTFSNNENKQLLLAAFKIKWRYSHGYLSSIAQGVALVPVAKYIIDLPVDTDDDKWKEYSHILSPAIALPPGTKTNPSLSTLRLQLHYHFTGRIKYHPCSDWNIIYNITGITDSGKEVMMFKEASWRN